MAYFWVFIGGGLGSICRFGIAKAMTSWTATFPWATLVANFLACIVLGFLVVFASKSSLLSQEMKWLLMVGFCGGFSTFSTFSNETFALFQNGALGYAILNILASVLLCLAAIFLGMTLAQKM